MLVGKVNTIVSVRKDSYSSLGLDKRKLRLLYLLCIKYWKLDRSCDLRFDHGSPFEIRYKHDSFLSFFDSRALKRVLLVFCQSLFRHQEKAPSYTLRVKIIAYA